MALLGVSSISPAFPKIVVELGLSPQDVGLLITMFTLPGVFLAPVVGVLADRVGRKRILVPSLFLFGIAGFACFFAGVCGAFYAHYQNLLVPNTFRFLLSIYVQMYALIGGLGFFIAGPIVGAGVMVFLPESLRVAEQLQPIFFAILIILIVIFLPGGILSIPDRIRGLTGRFAMTGKGSKG